MNSVRRSLPSQSKISSTDTSYNSWCVWPLPCLLFPFFSLKSSFCSTTGYLLLQHTENFIFQSTLEMNHDLYPPAHAIQDSCISLLSYVSPNQLGFPPRQMALPCIQMTVRGSSSLPSLLPGAGALSGSTHGKGGTLSRVPGIVCRRDCLLSLFVG